MGGRTFRELEAEMFRLYGAQEYSQAWALVERERTRALHGLLQSAGVTTELEIQPGLGHGIPGNSR